MSEKLEIEVEGKGAAELKQQLFDIGREGTRVAQQLRQEFRKGLLDVRLGATSTNLAREASIAMKSFSQAQAAEARQVKQLQKEMAAAARQAEKEKVAAAREGQREVAAAARAGAQQDRLWQRMRVTEARNAEREIIAARRAEAAASARFVREEINRAQGLRRARVAQERAAAREEAAARRGDRDASKAGSQGMSLLTGAVGIFGIRELIRDFAELSDSMQNARNRIRIVSGSQAEMEQMMQTLRKTALSNRTEFDLTTRTYARMAQATRQLNIGQTANIALTDTLTKAIAVSGATGEEAHATLIQLSQAMASNRLSADEFRSVAEQLPIVLDLLATSTGKPRTALKKMGEEGLLTTRVLTLAILEGQKKMADLFAKTEPTIEQALTNVKTNARFAMDEFNRVTGASKEVVAALQWMSNNMSTVTSVVKTLGEMLGGFLVYQSVKATAALAKLAVTNPFLSILVNAPLVFNVVQQYRDQILDILGIEKELVIVKNKNAFLGFNINTANRADAQVRDPATGKLVRRGTTEDVERRARVAQNLAEGQRELHEEAQKEALAETIKRLRAMKDDPSTKKKHGRHITTFEEAVSGLEDDVSAMTLNPAQRTQLEEIMKVQDRMNGQLREGEKGYKHLTESQRNYVATLAAEKREMENKEKFAKEAFRAYMEREAQVLQRSKEVQHQEQKAHDEEDKRNREMGVKIFDRKKPITSMGAADADRAYGLINQRQMAGSLSPSLAQEFRDKVEAADERTETPRRQFLLELQGRGKTAEDVERIFGPDGTISSGLANATAQAIVFHKSFKASLHDLGQTIQAEIIRTLVQGLIRMAILSAMGGGTVSKAVTAIGIPAGPGTGRAAGGYTGMGPRTAIAGYHHYGEFVMPAQQTAQNRDVLESMRRGESVRGGGTKMNVTVINQHSGVEHEVQQIDHNTIYIIAKRAVKEHASEAVASSLHDRNSKFSQQLGRATDVRFQR